MSKRGNNRTIRGIPEDDYWRLVVLLGSRAKADKLIEEEERNYRGIVMEIYYLELKQLFRRNPKVRILIIASIILVVVYLIQYFVLSDPIVLN